MGSTIEMNLFSCILMVLILMNSFNSNSQNVAIELQKMNVFYKEIENPIKIGVENYPCEQLVVKAMTGELRPRENDCEYFYYTDSCNYSSDKIFVGVKKKMEVLWLDTLEYRLKTLPQPTPLIAIHNGEFISKDRLVRATRVRVQLLNFDFQLEFKVTKYSVEIKRGESYIYSELNVEGNRFSDGLISQIKDLQKDDIVVFFNIDIESDVGKCWEDLGIIYLRVM